MSTKRDELANPNSCLNKAADDEPIFVLRANDPVAAMIVRQWADLYVIEKREYSTDGTLTHAQLSKAQEARGLANQMDSWLREAKRPAVYRPQRCPTCGSPTPQRHPATQHEGELQPCNDAWHIPFGPVGAS